MGNEAVYDLLVEFSTLGATEQGQFIENLNQFLFASATQRRCLRKTWKQASFSAVERDGLATEE